MRRMQIAAWTAIVLCLAASCSGQAQEAGKWAYPPTERLVHVSPDGKPDGDGSKERPLDIFTALGAKSLAQPGDTIVLAGGTYNGKMDGIKRVPFELAVSGAEGKPLIIMPAAGESAHLNGTVLATSSYAYYVGLDIGDLEWDPWGKKHKADTAVNVTGGKDSKFINCNIFGGAMGTGCWQNALNLELYGCLIHDFGYLEEKGRGHGHAYYTQNKEGRKVFKHNLCYRGCGWNIHVYTQASSIEGYDIVQNICYIAGQHPGGPKQTMDNYLIAGYPPCNDINLIGNVGYQSNDVETWRPNARLAHYRAVVNGTAKVKDNYLAGCFYGLSLGRFGYVEVTGNTIWSTGIFMEISSSPTGCGLGEQGEKPGLGAYKVDGNTYVSNGKERPFRYSAKEVIEEQDLLTFQQWQAMGLDKNSQLLPGKDGKPTGAKVFVFPNQYCKGRANIAVFNWDGKDKVEVDLSKVLEKGQSYRVYNCLDIKQTLAQAQPIVKGVYDGKSVSLPMRKDPISPDFDAFLLLPGDR